MKTDENKDSTFPGDFKTVIASSSDESIVSALNKMKQHGVHYLPIVDHGKIRGVILDRDIFASDSEWHPPYGSVHLADPFTQRLLRLLADVGI